jgi:hypothetical protein
LGCPFGFCPVVAHSWLSCDPVEKAFKSITSFHVLLTGLDFAFFRVHVSGFSSLVPDMPIIRQLAWCSVEWNLQTLLTWAYICDQNMLHGAGPQRILPGNQITLLFKCNTLCLSNLQVALVEQLA